MAGHTDSIGPDDTVVVVGNGQAGIQLADSLRRIRACPPEVWAVKLADRITNLQQPPPRWTAEKRARYRDEARAIHAALAGGHAVLAARLAERIEAYAAHL